MITKDIIRKIANARRSHIACVSHAAVLVEGSDVIDDDTPKDHHECPFGQWYYQDGLELEKFSEYQAIEQPHFKLHQTYHDIYKIMVKVNGEPEDNRSFFQKIKGEKIANKNTDEEREEARKLVKILQQLSNEVVAHLTKLETKLKTL